MNNNKKKCNMLRIVVVDGLVQENTCVCLPILLISIHCPIISNVNYFRSYRFIYGRCILVIDTHVVEVHPKWS